MERKRTVAGLDVHKDTIYLCIMGHDGTIIFEKTYGTLTPELRQMCSDMVERGVSECAMESTAVYWMPVWNELEGSMALKLVNPYFIKQLPGRKSDVKDAQWIAECLLKDLIKGSFVPEGIIQDMRKLNRRMFDINEDITYYGNKLDAALQRCGFRLSNYVPTIRNKSYRKIIDAIIDGERDPAKLAAMVHGRTVNRVGMDVLVAAMTAAFSECDIIMFRHYRDMIALYQQQLEECQSTLTAMCEKYFPEEFRRLQTIPGVKERAATAIIAETGVDMKTFATAAMLVGWCGLKPRNDMSNGRFKSRRITHGNRYLRQIMIECAWCASRTKNCFFSNFSYVQVTQKHKNKMKVQVAIARKMLVAVWNMLTKKEDFIDFYLKQLELIKKEEERKTELEKSLA